MPKRNKFIFAMGILLIIFGIIGLGIAFVAHIFTLTNPAITSSICCLLMGICEILAASKDTMKWLIMMCFLAVVELIVVFIFQ